MKLTPLFLALGLLPGIALAAPQVIFQGEVTDQTCKASISDNTGGIILLPPVPLSALNAPGATAGLTPFTIAVKDCAPPTGSAQAIKTNFLGHNVTAGGNLGNSAAGGAQNVHIQLTTTAAGTTPIVLNGVTPVAGLSLPAGQTSTSYDFGARYIVEGGTATTGAVTAVVEYALSYL